MKRIGFTGTREGMTELQYAALAQLLIDLGLEDDEEFEFHHGDCIGADSQAHELVINYFPFQVQTVAHPGQDGSKRAFCDADQIRSPMDNLARNACIAGAATDVLIACPRTKDEIVRSGTWQTVRTAHKLNNAKTSDQWRERPIYIIDPDGNVTDYVPFEFNRKAVGERDAQDWL